MAAALPSDDDDAVDVALFAEVHHPDGMVDEVVVEDGAPVERRVQIAVHRQRGPSVLPVLPQVTLVVQPSVAVVRQVLHCENSAKMNDQLFVNRGGTGLEP